ncbi:MAG TPA: hypothetical protein VF627_03095 [Abditibacterium sp.]
MMRKMLWMGAMFTTLTNVNGVSAWANPSDTRVAALEMRPSDTDSGCPVEEPIPTQERQPPGGDPVEPEKTPCQLALESLRAAEGVLNAARAQEDAALAQHTAAGERLDALLLRVPEPTAAEVTAAVNAVDEALRALNLARVAVINAGESIRLANQIVAVACAGELVPEPIPDGPPPRLDASEESEQFFTEEG